MSTTEVETIMSERRINTRSSISQLSHKQPLEIKQEPKFAINCMKLRGNSKKFGRGRVTKNKGEDSHFLYCGEKWGTRHDCIAKGQEYHLCKKKGQFATYCRTHCT